MPTDSNGQGGGRGTDAFGNPGIFATEEQRADIAQNGGTGKKGGPAPGDYMKMLDTMNQANRPNINTPGGSQRWSKDKDGNWTMDVSMAPQMQSAYDNLFSQANEGFSQPLDFSGAPQVGDGSQARQRAEDAIYSRQASRLDPMWAQREEGQRAQLAAQGLDPSSEAGAADLGAFGRARNDAYSGAMQNAIIGGGAEASRQQGMDMNARQQYISELLQRRAQPLNELSGLLRGQQIATPQMPGFMPGANGFQALQGQQDSANATMSQYADLFKGVTNLFRF